MEKEVSKIKMLLVLIAVCLISAAVLGYIHVSTADRIQLNMQARTEEAVKEVLPNIERFEKISETPLVYQGYNGQNSEGYAILSEGMGFQGTIGLMLGLNHALDQLTGMVVLESVETPGLGDKINGKDFRQQFNGYNISQTDSVDVETITGATISSVAVEKIINRAIKDVKRIP